MYINVHGYAEVLVTTASSMQHVAKYTGNRLIELKLKFASAKLLQRDAPPLFPRQQLTEPLLDRVANTAYVRTDVGKFVRKFVRI